MYFQVLSTLQTRGMRDRPNKAEDAKLLIEVLEETNLDSIVTFTWYFKRSVA
jgi:hypothetical protein